MSYSYENEKSWLFTDEGQLTDAVSGRYVATVQLAGGELVFHVFVGLGA